MHEFSLVRSLLQQVRQLAADHGGGAVRHVRLQLGPLSGFEPALLLSAWQQSRDDGGLSRAELEIESVPLEAVCQNCSGTFQPLQFRFVCPVCGSGDTNVVRGDGVVLESIVLEESQPSVAT
jgi:hydrogenase nickel incorporation protein HypA/HybF